MKLKLVWLPTTLPAHISAAKITTVQRYQFDFHLPETEGMLWDRYYVLHT